MFGTSWGGTASLQASVDAPEALAAVIAVCATHDRYEDDIHHKGGCLLTDAFEWGATLPAILALPPTRNVGEDWRERWEARLRSLAFPLEDWVREEARGAYWRRGSVIHETERLSCPILAVGGWSDGYSNSVMSLVGARPDLVWGVVGPWGHHYPDQGHPGPAIGFQQLALGWWDHWLRQRAARRGLPALRQDRGAPGGLLRYGAESAFASPERRGPRRDVGTGRACGPKSPPRRHAGRARRAAGTRAAKRSHRLSHRGLPVPRRPLHQTRHRIVLLADGLAFGGRCLHPDREWRVSASAPRGTAPGPFEAVAFACRPPGDQEPRGGRDAASGEIRPRPRRRHARLRLEPGPYRASLSEHRKPAPERSIGRRSATSRPSTADEPGQDLNPLELEAPVAPVDEHATPVGILG